MSDQNRGQIPPANSPELSSRGDLSSPQSIAVHQQAHSQAKDQAQALWQDYLAGDRAAIELFEQYLAEARQADFSPRLQDARAIIMRQSLQFDRLNLQKLRKEAKQLLRQLRAQQSAAFARLQAWHPSGEALSVDGCKLADAQLIIARELGLASWPKLKRHIEDVAGAEESLRDVGDSLGNNSLDSDLISLHLRCGSDLKAALPAGGFTGDFFEISNPFPQGRVVPSDPLHDFLDCRSAFVKSAYGCYMPDDKLQQSRQLFAGEEARLRSLPEHYQRLLLWFEHDAFDQLSFAYILHHLAELELEAVAVELIQVDSFPGFKRFIGLGQLAQQPHCLRLLWQQRRSLTAADISFGSRIWQAYTGSDPMVLWQLCRRSGPLPLMQNALLRMLQELPWLNSGLSLTERLALTVIEQDGAMTRQRLFHFLTAEAEPQPFLGDVMFFSVLDALTEAVRPALSLSVDEQGGEVYRLTPLGRALLAGEANWLDGMPPERWLGGVLIKPGAKNWHWSSASERPEYV